MSGYPCQKTTTPQTEHPNKHKQTETQKIRKYSVANQIQLFVNEF